MSIYTHRGSYILIRVFFRLCGTYSLIHLISVFVLFDETRKNVITEDTVPNFYNFLTVSN